MISIAKAELQESVIRLSGIDFNVLDYSERVTSTREYESGDDYPVYDSRRDSFNRLYNAAGGRQYSIHFLMNGLSLTEISRLHFMRFNVDGIEVIGRDIITRTSISTQEIKRMIQNVLKSDALKAQKVGKQYSRRTMTRENGEVRYWTTETGKRSYKGEVTAGEAHYKDFSREPKQYKRNRKVR